VAVAEVADDVLWQRLILVVCAVSNDPDNAQAMLSKVASFVEGLRPDLQVLDYETEIISGI
jgi:uncharacterized protein YlxP (DUF503 family)